MIQPKQMHLRRTTSEAGWWEYCDNIWNALLPSGFQFPILGFVQYRPWCMTRDGCISGLTIYAYDVPGYPTEIVHVRVSCNNGVKWVTPDLLLVQFEHCAEIDFDLGAYPFTANDLIHIEHKVVSGSGYNAANLEAEVEMAYE
jgi:hypothetical protein